jgi:hypothetical protein
MEVRRANETEQKPNMRIKGLLLAGACGLPNQAI